MLTYKLSVGVSSVKKITDAASFERETGKDAPYYGADGSQYAVCPRCDNPIQIVALYRRTEVSPRAYGKHIAKSISGLAEYNHDDYLCCLYANPKKVTKDSRRSCNANISNSVLQLLKEQFDRVVYLLRKDTGIMFSKNLLRKMLQKYLTAEGFAYDGAFLTNVPWMFGYMAHLQSLYGQRLKDDCDLKNAIIETIPEATFNEYGRLGSGAFLNINFYFGEHHLPKDNDEKDESLDFIVWQGLKDHSRKEIYKKTIIIKEESFFNLINIPEEKAQRNAEYLAIAEELIK